MKKLIGIVAIIAAIAAPAFGKEAKKPADFVITVANAGSSALTSLTITEVVPAPVVAPAAQSNDWWMAPVNMVSSWTAPAPAAPTTRIIELLKKPIAAKKSASVVLGKACAVTISAKFEDGSTVDPVGMDLCKDKKLNIGG
jgi:hypothetical protein